MNPFESLIVEKIEIEVKGEYLVVKHQDTAPGAAVETDTYYAG